MELMEKFYHSKMIKDFFVVAALTLGYRQAYYSIYYKIPQLNFFAGKLFTLFPGEKNTMLNNLILVL